MSTYRMNSDLDPGDRLDHCADKIAFIADAFITADEELTEAGKTGLTWILQEIESELRFIFDETDKMLNKRKEKKA